VKQDKSWGGVAEENGGTMEKRRKGNFDRIEGLYREFILFQVLRLHLFLGFYSVLSNTKLTAKPKMMEAVLSLSSTAVPPNTGFLARVMW